MATDAEQYASHLRERIISHLEDLKQYFFIEEFLRKSPAIQEDAFRRYLEAYHKEAQIKKALGIAKDMEEFEIDVLTKELIRLRNHDNRAGMPRRSFLKAAAGMAAGAVVSPSPLLSRIAQASGLAPKEIKPFLLKNKFFVYDALCYDAQKPEAKTIIFFLDKASELSEMGIHDWKTDYDKITFLSNSLQIRLIGIEGWVDGGNPRNAVVSGTPELVREMLLGQSSRVVGLEHSRLQEDALEIALLKHFWAAAFYEWHFINYQGQSAAPIESVNRSTMKSLYSFAYRASDPRRNPTQLLMEAFNYINRRSILDNYQKMIIARMITQLYQINSHLESLYRAIPQSEREFMQRRASLFRKWSMMFSEMPEGIMLEYEKLVNFSIQVEQRREKYAAQKILRSMEARPERNAVVVFGSSHADTLSSTLIAEARGGINLITTSFGPIPQSHFGKGYSFLRFDPRFAKRIRLYD